MKETSKSHFSNIYFHSSIFFLIIHSCPQSTYYGNYGGGGACGLDQPDGSAIPAEVRFCNLLLHVCVFGCFPV